jgi:uncharacterized linocin/CFP29 family protein
MDYGGAAWGAGWDWFNMNQKQRKQFAANQMASNASTLERDEYETLSDRIIQTYKRALVGLDDLQSEGLTRSISLATQVDLWQTVNEVTEAEITMDGEDQSNNDRIQYTTQGVPVPIVHKDFRIPQRELETSRRMNNDLRTDTAAEVSRAVAEMANQLLFQGWNPAVDTERGDSWELYGYTSSEVSASVSGSDFGTAGNIRDVFTASIDKLMDENNQEPAGDGFIPYISQTQYRQYRNAIDPDGDGNLTVRERIENEFDMEIQEPRSVPDYVLPDGEMVMVNPTPDVVELALAEDLQTVEWTSGSGMTNYFKTLWAGAPEIKVDSKNNFGVVHVTGI